MRSTRIIRRSHHIAGMLGLLIVPALSAAAPPVAPHVVVSQPQTDGVVLEGYPAGAPVAVQVLRGGNLVNAVNVTPVSTPGGGGGGAPAVVGEVNNVEGGVCWPGFTPDITHGDLIRVVSPGLVEDATVQHLTINQATQSAVDAVEVTGTAQGTGGGQLALDGLEAQLNGTFETALGGPFLRIPGPAGSLLYTPPAGTSWTATFTNLTANDVTTALNAPSFIGWTTDAGTGSEVTEVEFGATGGPQGACSAPVLKNGATSTTPASYRFDSATLAVHGIAEVGATDVRVTVADGTPLTADVQLGPVAPTITGGGAAWTLAATAGQVQALADGPLTITPRFTIGGNPVTGPPLTITKDMVPPDLTAPVASITTRPKPFVASTVAAFVLASTEAGRFECSLDGGPFATCFSSAVFTALAPGAHRLAVRAVDGAGNIGPEAAATWVVDLIAPRLTAGITAANRRSLTGAGRPVATVRCNEVCTVAARTRIVIAGQTFMTTSRRAITFPAARSRGIATATLTARQRTAVRAAVLRGLRVRVFITVTATDRAGNRSRTTANTTLRAADL